MSSNVSGQRDSKNIDYVLRSGLAGGIAGCVAKTVVAPLDRVKILFQASNPDFQQYAGTWSGAYRAGTRIFHDSGVRGLFQGHSATLLRVFPYAAIKFMAYDQIHNCEPLLMSTRRDETNFRRFSAGAISGLISVFFTYPLEVTRVRMAFQTDPPSQPVRIRPSFIQAVHHMYYETASIPKTTAVISPTRTLFTRFPILKFYRGFTATIVGMIPYAGMTFLCWGYLRARFVPYTSAKKATPVADLAVGAVSGAVAQTVSYPLEVIRRRMQVGGVTRPDRWLRWGETMSSIWRTSGWRGFYVGLSIGYLKIVPMTAVSFAVWQEGKRLLAV
ncbi:mitochondrial carrier domain-containing protein [Armillaria novae-zelandiae]|uniref:Mitochondrial carrier domain-containing protein n=1 Tax=Armillaria novae-zelandiae TaxID=153914 RepID=A0AA39PKG6_9AGAR|nr:mitochondrial carrier domain-containing protein [Armillaria novae-zelandiae]